MIKNKIRQIWILLKDLHLYTKMKYFSTPLEEKEKVVYINITFPQLYHRYFYALIKTLKIGGYKIIYPLNFFQFRNLRNGDAYIALLFKENNLLDIRSKNIKNHYIVLDDNMLSANYYKTYFEENNNYDDHFHIPMSFHPYMYSKNLWCEDIRERDILRNNSVFCFGNFDEEAYKKVHQSKFKIVDRRALLEFFSKKENFISVQSRLHLEEITVHNTPKNFVFVEKQNYQIPMENIRYYLSKFRYFLCCPGVFAPLSHNFVESVSVGCIPIIQKSYADTIYPPLEHKKNAFIFNDLKDLEKMIENLIFSITDEEYLKMKHNIQSYYTNHLHPKAVAQNIIDNLHKTPIFVNASERSIAFHKKIAS